MANVRQRISISNMNTGKPNQTLTHSKRSRNFSMQSEYCPLCSKNGAKVRIKAYQLNLEEAVFMCSTEECTWPVGYHELLFMDRPLGKFWTKDWSDVADKFLAEHLKKQRDSLSELSAYTPPQTPGNSKDTIHETTSTTAGPSSSPMVKEIDTLQQQQSTSKSIPFEIPVIDFTGNNTSTGEGISFEIPIIDCTGHKTSTFDDKTVSSESVLGLKSEKSPVKVLFITKDDSATKTLVNPLAKHSLSLVNKSVVIKDEKSSFVPEKSVISDNVQCKKFRIIGKQKSKSFNYKKQFDIFDDIKKAKSTNEQCKAKVAIKSRIDLDKMKPNEIRDVLFMNSKSKTNNLGNVCELESTEKSVIKLEPVKRLIKVEKKVYKSDVNSQIEVEKRNSNASSLIQTPNGDHNCKVVENVSLELSKKEPSHNDYTHYDINTIMDSPAEFESDKSWSGDHHNLDSLLAMLEDDAPGDNLMTTASASNDTLSNEQLKNEKIVNDVSSDLKMEVDSIIDDDTLQCTIEDTDDPFFASLFSPPTKQ